MPTTNEGAALDGFVGLVEAHSGALFRYLLRIVGNRALAEDLLQETFAAAYARRDGFHRRGSARTWLFTIARNRGYNAIRDARRTVTDADALVRQLDELPASSPGPEAQVLQLELRAEIISALQQLPPSRREAVVLRDIEGLSYAEIAAITSSSEGATRVQVHRARQQLQELLEPYLKDEFSPPNVGSEVEDST